MASRLILPQRRGLAYGGGMKFPALGLRAAVLIFCSCPLQTLIADILVDAPGLWKAEPITPLALRAFPLTQVKLLDGVFKKAMELDEAYLLALDTDRLLHNFRVNARLPSNATPLEGWEEAKCELRGHFVGHDLSACALMYASTGDERFKS